MAKVIIDTSIWVDFFNAQLSSISRESLTSLIETDQVAITNIIRHEILVGSRNDPEFLRLSQLLTPLTEYEITPELSSQLDRFGFELKRKGLKGRYTDLTIAFLARHHRLPVCSFDNYFSRLAQRNIIKLLCLHP